jgi:hypothetical protein
MENLNELLSRIESARLWGCFHKDWLIQIRLAMRLQLPADYRVFVEAEAVLITPDAWDSPVATVLPDVAVARSPGQATTPVAVPVVGDTATAIIEADEPCETEIHYSLIIRRAPDNHVVAAAEPLSPSNKGLGNRLDQEKHLRKRAEYFDAGISLLEIDALTGGQRVLPDALARLQPFDRVVWTAFHDAGLRRYRGMGWNQSDPLPHVEWRIDSGHAVHIDLAATLRQAAGFNQWETLAPETD